MQLFVEKRLKSPKSADFTFGGYRHVTALGRGRYKVDFSVDVQNSFGAVIRTHFEGVIKRVDGGWKWNILTSNKIETKANNGVKVTANNAVVFQRLCFALRSVVFQSYLLRNIGSSLPLSAYRIHHVQHGSSRPRYLKFCSYSF